MNGMIPTASALTTTVKNVYDITTSMLSTRKQHKLVTAGQLQLLGNEIQRVLEEDRMAGIHLLESRGRNYLIDSYNQILEYANTEFGDMLMETLRKECRFFDRYCEDYERMTKPVRFR